MIRAQRFAAILGAMLALTAGCGHPGVPATPPGPPSPTPASSASVAAPSSATPIPRTVPVPPAFTPVMPLLRPAKMPVYLPTWLPALPSGESYYFTGQADAGSYQVGIGMSQQPAAADSLPDLPNTDQIGSIAGGPPGHLGPEPTVATPSGQGQSVDVGSGVRGTYYAQPPGGDLSLLQWQAGGWTFQVADVTGLGAPADRLVSYAQKLMAGAPSASTPVSGVQTGEVVQTLSPDGAPTWVVWQRSGWEYRVQAHNAPAVQIAHSMVHVAA